MLVRCEKSLNVHNAQTQEDSLESSWVCGLIGSQENFLLLVLVLLPPFPDENGKLYHVGHVGIREARLSIKNHEEK